MIRDPLGVFLVLVGIVCLAVWLESRFRVARSLSAGLMCLVFGMGASNSGLLPGDAAAYDQLGTIWVNAAIVLILLSVDLSTVREAGREMLGAFGLGAVGTMLGAFLATLLLGGAIGAEAWKLTGQFTGTYIGGGANFYALAGAFDTDSNLLSAAVAADVIVTALWLIACLALPALFSSARRSAGASAGGRGPEAASSKPSDAPLTLEQRLKESGESLRVFDFFGLAAISLGVMTAARLLGGLVPAIPSVLWLTTMALLLGHTPAVRRLRGAPVLGYAVLLLFLAGNGAQSLVSAMLAAGPALFLFAATTVGVHGVVIFGVGRLLRWNAGTLAVASQANIGGAASAVAIASARGYGDRLLPGIAVSLAGYAVGNYLGYGMGMLSRAVFGG